MRFALLSFVSLALLWLAPSGRTASPTDYFSPSHRVTGIGVSRDDISRDVLDVRTDLMIQSQTFSIMRDPQAVPGAKRITSPKLASLIRRSALNAGFPPELLEAIAYLESWGEPRAESPAGPRGIMQISAATARAMGLKIVARTRYKISRERVLMPRRGKRKPRYVTVTHKTPYIVTVRDDRLSPDRAVPAAARYLAGMVQKYGGLDWAIFAYHCGQGCVNEMQELTRQARGIPKDQITVARMFFSANPAWNRELYEAIQQQMQRDWSPTYYFRVMRAEQLLNLYRRDPGGFESLAEQYRSEFGSRARAPHRLSVWLKREDMVFRSCDDIRLDGGRRLVKALDRPGYFGYRLHLSPDSPSDLQYFSQASPAALGTLTYIAFETHRLFDEVNHGSESFQPLDVTSLVEPEDYARQSTGREALSHCSGQVFDIDYSGLPPSELECLRFVLSDLGYEGYVGFVEEGRDTLHIGCSPSARDFFATVFQEAVGWRVLDQLGVDQ
jgi:hypothetical protein